MRAPALDVNSFCRALAVLKINPGPIASGLVASEFKRDGPQKRVEHFKL